MISKADIEKLAALSRIELSEEEKIALQKDMESILNYVQDIKSAPVKESGSLPVEPRNVLREDDAPHESGAYTEALLKEMPRSKDGFLVVKKIL